MHSFIGKSIFLLFPLLLFGGPPNRNYIKQGFDEFFKDTEENRSQYLKDNQVQLSPRILAEQVDNLPPQEKETFLKDQLKKIAPSDQQALINSLNKEITYSDLLMNISTQECERLIDAINPEYFGITPLIDWMNTSNLNSFFNPTMKTALLNRNHYNDFNSFDQFGIWTEPFGYFAKFHRKASPSHFNLYTLGLSLGGEYTFFDRLSLSAGFAYSYSMIHWKGYPLTQKGDDHALYFAPSLNCLFAKGYISCILLCAGNFYRVKRDLSLFPEEVAKKRKGENSYNSWDILTRIEGGLSLNLGANFYLYPTLLLDYLNVFQLKSSEKIEENVHLNIEGLHAAFFHSKVGIKVTWEVFQPGIGFIIPSFSCGSKSYLPLSTDSYRYKMATCSGEKSVSFSSWTQYFFDVGIACTHIRGMLLSLNYELTVGHDSPVQKGSFRIGWNW